MTLDEAIETLATTYADPVLIARGLPVDAKEVADALAKATPDTPEFVALTLLSKFNFSSATVVAIEEVAPEVAPDTTE
jgi:hypothetical protein